VVTVALYSPAHSHPFAQLDDGSYVYSNPHVRAGFTWETAKWAFTSIGPVTPDVPDWHPLAWLSHALDTDLFGEGPSGPHDVNLFLHVVNVVLLFWILQQATHAVQRSAMVAALFALHPINVESVAWIAERKNLLSMTFFLLALLAYDWYVRKPGAGRYLAVASTFALGLMSKPQVVTFPFVLLLWDFWPLERIAIRSSLLARGQNIASGIPGEPRIARSEERPAGETRAAQAEQRPFRWLLLEKLPLFILAAISCIITIKSQVAVGGINRTFPLTARIENAIVSYARYLAKAFWPSDLAPFYPHPGALPIWQVVGALLLLLLISALAIAFARRRYFLVGWLWFLGTLVPMIGLLQVNRQAMADRYAYLPFIGLFLLVCWGVSDLAQQRHLPPVILRTGGVAVLVVLAALTYRQISYWGDNLTLWTHALEVTQGNYLAENIVGSMLMDQGRGDDALPHFVAATQMNPSDPSAYMAIGTYDQQHGDVRQAITEYQKTVALTDDSVQKNLWLRSTTFARMGSAYRQLGELEQARTSFQKALEIDPKDGQVWLALGIVTAQAGDPSTAAEAYRRAVQIRPSDVGYLLLARALDQTGQSDQAQEARSDAQRLSRDLPAAEKKVDAIFAGASRLTGRP
jgi:protein O-mannosyl-transferase